MLNVNSLSLPQVPKLPVNPNILSSATSLVSSSPISNITQLPQIPNLSSLGNVNIGSIASSFSSPLSAISPISNVLNITPSGIADQVGGLFNGGIGGLTSGLGGQLSGLGSQLSGLGSNLTGQLSGLGGQVGGLFNGGLSSLGNIGSLSNGLGSLSGLGSLGSISGLTSGLGSFSNIGSSLGGLSSLGGVGSLSGLASGFGGNTLNIGGGLGGIGSLSGLAGGIGGFSNIGALASGFGGVGALSSLGGAGTLTSGLSSFSGGIPDVSSVTEAISDPMSLFDSSEISSLSFGGFGSGAVAAIYLKVLKSVSTKGKGKLSSNASKYFIDKPFNFMTDVSGDKDLTHMNSTDFDSLGGGSAVNGNDDEFNESDWGGGSSKENKPPKSDSQKSPQEDNSGNSNVDFPAEEGTKTADGEIQAKATIYSSVGDNYTDSGTAAGLGFRGNKLTKDSIAMSPELIKANGFKPGDIIQVKFSDGSSQYKYLSDQTAAGLKGSRVDFYNPTMANHPISKYDGQSISFKRVETSGGVGGKKLEAVQSRVSQLNSSLG